MIDNIKEITMGLTTINSNNIFKKGVIGTVRTAQEDSHDIATMTPNGDVFVVCDGMGGHVGGAKASSLAVESIVEFFKREKYDNVPQALNDAIQYANAQIFNYAAANPAFKGMGTTACIVVLQDREAYIAHVGDSRIYLYLGNEKQLHRITKDHSYVQTLVDAGEITDDQAEHHPNKNRILKALGIRPEVTPTVNVVHPKNGDIFMICTDGLNGMICDNTIEQALRQDMSLEARGDLLINLAMQGEPDYPGGQDNCTLELVNIDNSPWKTSEFISFNPIKNNEPQVIATPQIQTPPVQPHAQTKKEETPKESNPIDIIKSLPIKKILLIAIPAIIVLTCLCSIPTIQKNSMKSDLEELNAILEKSTVFQEIGTEQMVINDKIDRIFGKDYYVENNLKASLEKIMGTKEYKEEKDNYKKITELYDYLSKPSKESTLPDTDKKEQPSFLTPDDNNDNDNENEKSISDNKSFKREKDIKFGITSINLNGEEYIIEFKNKDKFYPSHISELFGCSKEDILSWNNISSDTKAPGAGHMYTIKKDKNAFKYEVYVVKSNDILGIIAEEKNKNEKDIMHCNGLEYNNKKVIIQPGQKLVIITKE